VGKRKRRSKGIVNERSQENPEKINKNKDKYKT